MHFSTAVFAVTLGAAAFAANASVVYYVEGEDFSERNANAVLSSEPGGGGLIGLTDFSSGNYVVNNGGANYGRMLYVIPADTLPAGDYFIAERAFLQVSRGSEIDYKYGTSDITTGFTALNAYTLNDNLPAAPSWAFDWNWARTDFVSTGSANRAVVTVVDGQPLALRLTSNGSGGHNLDVFALISATLDAALPSNVVPDGGKYISVVPEPASIGLLGVAGLMLARRRQK